MVWTPPESELKRGSQGPEAQVTGPGLPALLAESCNFCFWNGYGGGYLDKECPWRVGVQMCSPPKTVELFLVGS